MPYKSVQGLLERSSVKVIMKAENVSETFSVTKQGLPEETEENLCCQLLFSASPTRSLIVENLAHKEGKNKWCKSIVAFTS